MYKIIQKRNIFLTISSILVGLSIISLFIWGLNYGIDFSGGSLLEIKFDNNRPAVSEVQDVLNDLDLGSLMVQPVDDSSMILRFQNITEEKHQEIISRLNTLISEDISDINKEENINATSSEEIVSEFSLEEKNSFEELRYDSVGPTIGAELKRKSLLAIIIVLIAIVVYIAWAFRRVSKPVESWKYGISAIIALFHDVIITLGIFALLGKFWGIEINSAFVAAILTVLGYSVNDSIVVFDRVRENLPKSDEDFEGTVNTSVNQSITRSINTSVTTLIVLLSILFFGGSTIKDFILALSIGVFIGTYSSIFLASPILVLWEKLGKK
jgi:preprotein translocase subunit SecF